MARRTLSALVLCALACLAIGPAGLARANTADTIAPQHSPPDENDGWQAATCITDVPPCSPSNAG